MIGRRVSGLAALMAILTPMLAVSSAPAEELGSGWSISHVEAPLGETSSCAATKMTGEDRGIGFTQLSSGMETMTVAVKGWSYPLGAPVHEMVKIGDGAPVALKALGQNDATVAPGKFTTDKALRAATSVDVAVADMHRTFDIVGIDKAFEALKTCMAEKS